MLDAINAAVTKAFLQQSGNGRPMLRENLLNVKVKNYLSTSNNFEWFSGVFQHTEPKGDQ